MGEVEVGLTFMGEDMIARVEYGITHWGSVGARWKHPCDPDRNGPEFEIERIWLRRDLPSKRDPKTARLYWPDAPEFEATGALFRVLAWDDDLTEAVQCEVEEETAERFRRRRRAF